MQEYLLNFLKSLLIFENNKQQSKIIFKPKEKNKYYISQVHISKKDHLLEIQNAQIFIHLLFYEADKKHTNFH